MAVSDLVESPEEWKISRNLLPRLFERDIDVLLQEEVIFNEAVKCLFAGALGLSHALDVTGCQLSVSDASGETDVLVTFSLDGSSGVILIENKIDAAFQPRQPERYRERAGRLASPEHGFDAAFCVLVAPKAYAREGGAEFAQFDGFVSYEAIASAIEIDRTPRARHRAALLRRAVDQARSSYVLVPEPAVTGLWDRIYSIASSEYPILNFKQPGEKGVNSSWVIFKADLPPRITIDWKIKKGTVDLSFWKGAVHAPISTTNLAPLRAATARAAILVKLGQSTAIRIPISPAPTDFVQIRDDQIREALQAGVALLSFYRDNPKAFS